MKNTLKNIDELHIEIIGNIEKTKVAEPGIADIFYNAYQRVIKKCKNGSLEDLENELFKVNKSIKRYM